jgi:hypothetical protein
VEGWWAETGKYNVLPLDDSRFSERLLGREEDTSGKEPKSSTLSTMVQSKDIPERSAPHTKNRSHSIITALPKWKFLSRRCRRPNMCKEKAVIILPRLVAVPQKDRKLVYCHNNYAGTYYYYYELRPVDNGWMYLLKQPRRRSDSS